MCARLSALSCSDSLFNCLVSQAEPAAHGAATGQSLATLEDAGLKYADPPPPSPQPDTEAECWVTARLSISQRYQIESYASRVTGAGVLPLQLGRTMHGQQGDEWNCRNSNQCVGSSGHSQRFSLFSRPPFLNTRAHRIFWYSYTICLQSQMLFLINRIQTCFVFQSRQYACSTKTLANICCQAGCFKMAQTTSRLRSKKKRNCGMTFLG